MCNFEARNLWYQLGYHKGTSQIQKREEQGNIGIKPLIEIVLRIEDDREKIRTKTEKEYSFLHEVTSKTLSKMKSIEEDRTREN